MIALLWKELRGLKGYAATIIGIELLGVGYTLSQEYPDKKPFDPAHAIGDGNAIPILLFGLILGAGLLTRESDDGTLHFLDGLPVTRTRIFAAKLLAGFLVLTLIPLFDFGPDVLFGLMSRTSVDPAFPWRFVFVFLGVSLLIIAYTLSVAVALSFLRRWFALATGTIFLGYLWLQARNTVWIELFNPTSLEPGAVSPALLPPHRALAFQGAASLIALAVAWLCFRSLGSRSRDMMDRAGRFVRFLLMAARICTPIVWIGVLALLIRMTNQTQADGLTPAGEAAFAKRETKRYEFLFRESQRSFAAPLLPSADKVYSQVANFFGSPGSSERIVVDLASPVSSHAAGLTNWSKIRMLLTGQESLNQFRAVLGHETAHVIMHRLGGLSFLSESRSTRFFNEGMATVVEERLFETPRQIHERRRLTAAVISRGRVPFELLCDDEELSKTRDPMVVYPLGSAFGRALIRTCGAQAPARVVSEFSRPRFGSQSTGPALWRDVLHACGFSLDSIEAAYDSELNSIQTEESDFVKTLPRMTAVVEREGDDIVIRPRYEGDAPGKLICRIDHPTVLGQDIRWSEARSDGAIHIPRRQITGGTIRYMTGWAVKGLPWPVFEPWSESAAPQ